MRIIKPYILKNIYDHKFVFYFFHLYYLHLKCKIPFQSLFICTALSFLKLTIYRNQYILSTKFHFNAQTSFQNSIHKSYYIPQSINPIQF